MNKSRELSLFSKHHSRLFSNKSTERPSVRCEPYMSIWTTTRPLLNHLPFGLSMRQTKAASSLTSEVDTGLLPFVFSSPIHLIDKGALQIPRDPGHHNRPYSTNFPDNIFAAAAGRFFPVDLDCCRHCDSESCRDLANSPQGWRWTHVPRHPPRTIWASSMPLFTDLRQSPF